MLSFNVCSFSYAVGAIILTTVLVTRILHLQESKVWQQDQQQLEVNTTVQAAAAVHFRKTKRTSSPHHHSKDYDFSDVHSPISMVSSVSSLSAPSVVVAQPPGEELEPEFDHRPLQDVPEEDETTLESSASVSSFYTTYKLLRRHYGMRLLGVSLSWFLWDVAFYGNKLFQSTFLLALTGQETTTLLQFAGAATLNAAVALAGYVGAAAILDRMGRRTLQQWGFLVTGTLFVGVGFLFDQLSVALLVTMYLGSSFFGQLGPNATTFLIPAEIFPTELRTVCHGIAAASGKLGALTASILFQRVDNDLDMFLLSGYASFLACAVTYWTIPETTGLDLHENDRKWHMILAGRKAEYQGAANHPAYLSVYERHRLQRRKQEADGMNYLSTDLHDVHC